MKYDMQIKTVNDLRVAYIMLRMITRVISKCSSESYVGEARKKYVEYSDSIKREIRRYYKRQDTPYRIVHSDWDCSVFLIELGCSGDCTFDEADEYFKANHYVDMVYGDFDCTGGPFTAWYKLCRRRGKWYAYHSIGIDV